MHLESLRCISEDHLSVTHFVQNNLELMEWFFQAGFHQSISPLTEASGKLHEDEDEPGVCG